METTEQLILTVSPDGRYEFCLIRVSISEMHLQRRENKMGRRILVSIDPFYMVNLI